MQSVPDDVAEDSKAAEWLDGRPRHDKPIYLAPYDPEWPAIFEREATKIRAALGRAVVRLEHVGSTSVPGLSAKPIIDIDLEVPDTTDEPAYVPALETAGYRLTIREPTWFEHRLFKGAEPAVNLHTFSRNCPETVRMVAFRDWLTTNDDDRELYERTKRELSARTWAYVQDYADAKGDVVEAINARAEAAGGAGRGGRG
jgi:GrpB-like predicted nucleotidyltransferase (UPF0157 family)